MTEIDTQIRLTKLLRVLEDCISFVSQMPSASTSPAGSVDNNVLLEDYVVNTLLLDTSKWEDIKCPTIAQHVHLCHLQSLFLSLEDKREASKSGGGDPLGQVALKYREPLTESMLQSIRGAIALKEIDVGVFVPLLREFATEQLCSGELNRLH